MEAGVGESFDAALAGVEIDPRSAAAWGRLGRVAHAHELWDEATTAYRQAERLDPAEVRWAYFLGDVLSVVGTDLGGAVRAFRRAAALRPGYAPIHMRLGKVLLADGQSEAAATELSRALEIEPSLQPARVTLAQIRLAAGAIETAEALLEETLEQQPRHAQALSTLGQVYMRQGRRDEARAVAERAQTAATYNLFADTLMSEVVAEGASSVLLWERAKAFLDNGDNRQAALGLERVVRLDPDNADAHQQLGVAYGNLGDLSRSREHLEVSVGLAPERVDSLMQLALLALEQRDGAMAIRTLERVLELEPGDPDAPWLLGRAQLLGPQPEIGLATFERAEATGLSVPTWARNEWGSALAQNGLAQRALEQFEAALAEDPGDAQALFYTGLVLEGLGRTEEAVARYCDSLNAEPNPPASSRLAALQGRCGEH